MPSDQNKISFIDQIHNFVRTKGQDAYQNLAKGVPGHVSKILANDFIEFTFDVTGPFTLPKIQIPQAFSKYHREPTQVGDKGVAVPTDYSIAGPSGNDGSTANLYPRGNLTPLTFHPISNKNWPTKDPNMFLVTGGPSGHTTQSADGKTSMLIDIANNLLHTSSSNIIHQAEQAIAHIAQQTLTHASMGGVINMVVSKQLNIGAPSSSFSSTDGTTLPPIPVPSLPTIMNLIGSLIASGSISAAGGMAGAVGGGSAAPGSVGEVISSVVTTAVNLAAATATNVASILLTPGDWDIQGDVLFSLPAATGNVAAGINNVSATLPATLALNNARAQITAPLTAGAWATSLGPCRANITANTNYFLVGYSAAAATATGYIWARRMR